MTEWTTEIINILRDYRIEPENSDFVEKDFPEIGTITGEEAVYATSISNVLGGGSSPEDAPDSHSDDPRLRELWEHIKQLQQRPWSPGPKLDESDPPEPLCAWYCPVHFFGHGWGIYLREECILSQAREIARWVNWHGVPLSAPEAGRQVLRSAFYCLFLHEQFHHKVESFGFRLLVSTGKDHYRPYKRSVYRQTYTNPGSLEESLANAESHRRLCEPRYKDRVHPKIREGLEAYLKKSIPIQPSGYREGTKYIPDGAYHEGRFRLQSQIRDMVVSPTTPTAHWKIAPKMITALANIGANIYTILPKGAYPLFQPSWVDPGATVSSKNLTRALERYHGYQLVPGGKGSHIKLEKKGRSPIFLPGDRPVLSPGVVKHALKEIGGYPISSLQDLLKGKLAKSI